MTSHDELAGWWRETAEAEITAVVDKAIEYGATDLLDLGRELARINGWDMDDAQAAEAGVYVYLRGKVSRWTAALTEGRPVSDDTLHDIGVYVRMAQRIRQAGGWPGTSGPRANAAGPGEPREAPGGVPVPPRPREAPPVAYLAHPLDNGRLTQMVSDVKSILRALGCTIYDPGAAWEIGGPGDNSTVHDANLAVLERCDFMVVLADKKTFSAGTMIEATDRGRYAPGTVIVFAPNFQRSISMEAEGWTVCYSGKELATAVADVTNKEK